MTKTAVPKDSKSATIKNLKQLYDTEYKFISNLLSDAHLPFHESNSSDSDEPDDDIKLKYRDRIIRSKNTERAKSLQELHNRIAALKELKYTYKGKKLKNKLQSKLKRKKKIYEMKSKRNASAKDNTAITTSKCDTANDVELTKPMFNSEGNLVFSKFDFLGETSTINDEKILIKDVGNKKHILDKLQKNQQLIKSLEERGDGEKANRVKEDIAWKNMLRKAEGMKVKDDPTLLKKSLAKKQAMKKRSKTKWDERIKTVEKQKFDKQKKRTENLQKRAQEKKKKKFKKAAKKGRYIPNI